MIICGHQPEYLPYLGLVYKALKCDKFIFVDHVQYKHKNFQNRNQIRTANGAAYLTVPISGHHRIPITDIIIDNNQDWRKAHLNAIRSAYGNTKFLDRYFHFFEKTYSMDWEKLVDLDIHITKFIFQQFGVTAQLFRSSEYNLNKPKTELLIELCKTFKGDTYLQGAGGKDYIDEDIIKKADINLMFSDFKHPVYRQKFEPFIENMSAIDLLFNYGPEAKDILLGGK
jgi:hypothetical protein